MMLEAVFERFVKARPVCVMGRGILERLLSPDQVDEMFERTAEKQYTQELLFSPVVDLMSEVVLGLQPSVHAAYQSRIEEMTVSTTALYNKLDRVETGVSAELVRKSFRQAVPVIKALGGSQAPWLAGYRIKVLDGNHLSGTEHRIAELRNTYAAALPGKAVVVLDRSHKLIRNVFLTEDGHAQERSLINDVLDSVRKRDLWIADRNFCTLGMLFGMDGRDAFFLVRQHGQLKGQLIGQRRCIGKT